MSLRWGFLESIAWDKDLGEGIYLGGDPLKQYKQSGLQISYISKPALS